MTITDLIVPNGPGRDDVVPIKSILYIESDKKLCKIVTLEKAYTVSASLRSFVSKLPKSQFLRIHKSYLVSSRFINSISKSELYIGGRKLPVSRRLRAGLYSRYHRCR